MLYLQLQLPLLQFSPPPLLPLLLFYTITLLQLIPLQSFYYYFYSNIPITLQHTQWSSTIVVLNFFNNSTMSITVIQIKAQLHPLLLQKNIPSPLLLLLELTYIITITL